MKKIFCVALLVMCNVKEGEPVIGRLLVQIPCLTKTIWVGKVKHTQLPLPSFVSLWAHKIAP